MKRYLSIVLFILLNGTVSVFAQDTLSIDSVAKMLNGAMIDGNYQEAKTHADEIIRRNETVSNITLLNCAKCLIKNRMYSECISFCDKWKDSHANDKEFFPALFDACYGECYYFLGNNRLACDFLSAYSQRAVDEGFDMGLSYSGIYASSLHGDYQFAKADSVYKSYVDEILTSENLTLQNIHTSKNKSQVGSKLYEWAYNRIFQADERTGLKLLKAAALCDNEAAKADYHILLKSLTFAVDIKHKRKLIREFNEYIEELGNRNISMDAEQNFWQEVKNTNAKYGELQVALEKQKRPRTLKKALNELETNRGLVDSNLVALKPYRVDVFEKDLVKLLCGNKTFLKELRIYQADEPNAFATPYGQIYLTEGLGRLLHFNKNLLIGICAHEATHYLCQHSLVGLWQHKKKEKRNNIWTAIAVGLNTIAQASVAMYGASSGVEYDQDYWNKWAKNVDGINNCFIETFKEDTYYFQFKYARQQEIEADLMAYRFCESIGLGGYAYIVALELLGNKQGYLKADKTSDHPTNAYRIALLKHLYSLEHPTAEIKNSL